MAWESSRTVLKHLHTLLNLGVTGDQTDGQLLERFTTRHGEEAEAAFAALVDRHGPMVLRTCRGILRNDHDAEDAFQATFLILVRRRGILWVRDSLGPWLHRVACRVAVRAKVNAQRQREGERRAAEMDGRPSDAPARDDLREVLHQEIDRLPECFRMPIVLCDLEGSTYEKAAQELRCPVGTVKSRLARGRERLRVRLSRRGLDPLAGLLEAAITSNPRHTTLPAPLVESTIQAAMSLMTSKLGTVGSILATVKILTEEVSRAMLMHKMRLLGITLVTVGAVASGAVLLAKPKPATADPHPGPPEAARVDLEGNSVVVDDETEPQRRSVENNKTAEDSKDVAAKERAATPMLPTPPRQAEPWTPPPTSLPRFFLSATAALCEQGLADPRGCEYRKIRIARLDSRRGEARVGDTNGWVLPAANDRNPRHAIAWNGLVYPLTGVGEPADLDADVRALEDHASKVWANRPRVDEPFRPTTFHEFGCDDSEASPIAVGSLHSIKVCLVLRLGRADLAETLWDAGTGRPKGAAPPKFDLKAYNLSYLDLAKDFVWYRLSRAIRAHERGDDVLALADLRAIGPLVQAVEAKAEDMGFARPNFGSDRDSKRPYIDFLDHVPELLVDQERRARERANPPTAPKGTGPEARVAALIRNLDQVAFDSDWQGAARVLGSGRIADRQGPDRRRGRRRRTADPALPIRQAPHPCDRGPFDGPPRLSATGNHAHPSG